MKPTNGALILLLIAVVATAVASVSYRHTSRVRFAELVQLTNERDELFLEWGRLQLEQATALRPEHVEATARDQLGLRFVEPGQVVVLTP